MKEMWVLARNESESKKNAPTRRTRDIRTHSRSAAIAILLHNLSYLRHPHQLSAK